MCDHMKFCRDSKCAYYYGEINECMYGEDGVPSDMERKCESKSKPKPNKKYIKDSTELSGGHLW